MPFGASARKGETLIEISKGDSMVAVEPGFEQPRRRADEPTSERESERTNEQTGEQAIEACRGACLRDIIFNSSRELTDTDPYFFW